MRAALSLLLVCSCAESPAPKDAGMDSGSEDSGSEDSGGEDSGADAGVPEGGTYGFPIRIPEERSVDGMQVADADMICTLEWDAYDELVYVQAHATRWVGLGGFDFATDGIWISDGTTASAITGNYDYGGGHHNDSVNADVDQYRIRFFHSSFGFGFRACQPPDCIDLYDRTTMNPIQYGCDGRAIPAVCVKINADGTVPPLIDMFEKCPGDD